MTKTFFSIAHPHITAAWASRHRTLLSLPQIQSPSLRIEFDKNMRSRVVARFNGKEIPLGAFSASETVKGSERSWSDFALESQKQERITDIYGGGEKLTLTGTSGALRKTLSVLIYDEFPNLAVFDVSYTNTGKSQLKILEWNNNNYTIDAQRGSAKVPFWSFQSGSYERRPNWLVPLHTGFSQQNYLGMNASDYGGGTPIIDVWRRDVGIGVGHVDPRPRLISLPVSMPNARQARVSVQYRHDQTLGTRRKLPHFSNVRGCPRGRLLSDAAYLPQLHGEARFSDGKSARQRLRSDLVRLGIWTRLQAAAGLRHAAHREANGIYLGHAGRRLAE